MNLRALKLLILSHYLIDQSHSSLRCLPSHMGLRIEQMVFGALRPSKTIFTEFQILPLEVESALPHDTVLPSVHVTPIRNKDGKRI